MNHNPRGDIFREDDSRDGWDARSRTFFRTKALVPNCENAAWGSLQLASPHELPSTEESFLTQEHTHFPGEAHIK